MRPWVFEVFSFTCFPFWVWICSINSHLSRNLPADSLGLALRPSARLPCLVARSRLWIQPDLIFSQFMQFSCLFPLSVINFLLGIMKIKSNDFYAYIQLLNIRCLSWVLSSGRCLVQVNICSTVLCWRKMELHYSILFFLLANISPKGLNWA